MEKEFEGKTVADAINRAVLQLRLPVDEIEYTVIREESRRLFGLFGGQTALISVTVPEREGRDIVKDLIDSAFADHLKEAEGAAVPDEQPRVNEQAPVSAATRVVASRPEPSGETPRPEAATSPAKRSAIPLPKPAPRGEAATDRVNQGDGEIDADRLRETVEGILGRMGVEFTTVTLRRQEQDIFVEVSETGDHPVLVSRKGQVLDAMQYLLNKLHGVRGGRVYLDSGDYRLRHEDHIHKLALKMASRVKRTRKPASINALNAHDRRIVHLAIQEDGTLRSRSKGEGDYKKIVIYPKNGARRGGGDRDQQSPPLTEIDA
ncbi:MAG: Jag N-terminal domain-containing protein [Deltaproteobacteria bacterium]|nr:Jag N-terminal domain-containing protein [Candidatus Anaeroferrophillacea bacterium]